MFGIRYIKAQPTTYILHYARGKLIKEGAGLAFFYFAPTTTLVAIPIAAVDVPFVFKGVTKDYQEVAVQGQVTYRVVEPKKLAHLMNFTLDGAGRHAAEDPQKLPQRVVARVQVTTKGELQALELREAIGATKDLARRIKAGLAEAEVLQDHGIEIIDLAILAVRPNPETARALEAGKREELLKEADEAIYARRGAAVEQERTIKESELNTEIAVQNKRRQIEDEAMTGRIALEKKNADLVDLQTENARKEAEAKAFAITAAMKAYGTVDPKVIQALGHAGMQPDQLIALAFRDLAEKAEKIGQLNMTPELLGELLKRTDHGANHR